MQLLRCLLFIEAVYQFWLSASDLPRRDNVLADNLLRDRLISFRSKVPYADSEPTRIPVELPQLLFRQDLD